MPTKICPICGEEKDYNKYRLNQDGSIRGNDCTSCRSKKERSQLRLDFLKAFDSICNCCGEKDPRFLTLDHVNNDGNEHRKLLKEHQIIREAKNEGWPKNKYQCLCFNCNSGRASNGGVCPHKCISIEEYMLKLQSNIYYMGKQFVNHNTSNLPEARRQMALQRSLVKSLKGITPEQLEQLVNAASQKLA